MRRAPVGAHYGLKEWLAQRATAIFMAVYTVIFVFAMLGMSEFNYESWAGLLDGGLFSFLSFLFVLSVLYHAWVGVRNIWMDYVKPAGVRLGLHFVTIFVLLGYAGWAVKILWRL